MIGLRRAYTNTHVCVCVKYTSDAAARSTLCTHVYGSFFSLFFSLRTDSRRCRNIKRYCSRAPEKITISATLVHAAFTSNIKATRAVPRAGYVCNARATTLYRTRRVQTDYSAASGRERRRVGTPYRYNRCFTDDEKSRLDARPIAGSPITKHLLPRTEHEPCWFAVAYDP